VVKLYTEPNEFEKKSNRIITKGLKIRGIKLKHSPIEPQRKLKIIKAETEDSHKSKESQNINK
jgi:hypothetical protein